MKSFLRFNFKSGAEYIFIFNFRDGSIIDTPSMKLSADSCVTSIEFHPTLPAILAAATYAGL